MRTSGEFIVSLIYISWVFARTPAMETTTNGTTTANKTKKNKSFGISNQMAKGINYTVQFLIAISWSAA